ncbi:Putative ATP-dependent DNA helicase recG C-terminal [Bifidobacterium bohemicum]|uniref:Transcriptional regulator n=1 Tax=Bifidobacterium bohemicum DSM 22767 TaxID=1437606 RepID=A0A086ZFZ2_9BIFI|nr:ATP-binding protein [Bifidobacterium bohemicum]KFI45442.1 transcriptional regulator [Bifidobacterium bohemicum DSM 22767]SCB72841.1 Putative ATP-dependent DNA helicase recG C-terminal [Bifidobacterium bohemicum]
MANDMGSSEQEAPTGAVAWAGIEPTGQPDSFDHQPCSVENLTFEYAQAAFASAGLPWNSATMTRLHLTTAHCNHGTRGSTNDAMNDRGGDSAETATNPVDKHTGSSSVPNAKLPTYTNTALLISDQCPYQIKCAMFQGTTKTDLKERHDISGSVLAQIDRTMVFLNQHNCGHDALPAEALREALVNAILHRDYSLDGPTLVSLFASRVEIVSLGGLYGGLQVNDLLNGVSQTRNTWLAQVFEALKLSVNLGTGIQRILDLYAASTVSPQVRVGPTSVAMVLPKPVSQEDWLQPTIAENAFGGRPGELMDDDHTTGESDDDRTHTAKRYIFPPARRDLTHDPSAALAGARVISASPLSEAIEPLSTLILAGTNLVGRIGGDNNRAQAADRIHGTNGDALREVEALEEATLHLLAERGTVLSRAQIEQTLSLDREQTTVVLKALVDKGALDEHVEYSIAHS